MELLPTADPALVALARRGDPTAFFTLIEPMLFQRRLQLSRNLTQEQDLATFLNLLRECYRSYVRKKPSLDPAAWCEKRMQTWLRSAEAVGETEAVQQLTEADERYLHEEAQRALLRERTKLRRSLDSRHGFAQRLSWFHEAAAGRGIVIALAVLVILGIVGATLSLTRTAVTVVLTSPRGSEIVRFPPGALSTVQTQPVAARLSIPTEAREDSSARPPSTAAARKKKQTPKPPPPPRSAPRKKAAPAPSSRKVPAAKKPLPRKERSPEVSTAPEPKAAPVAAPRPKPAAKPRQEQAPKKAVPAVEAVQSDPAESSIAEGPDMPDGQAASTGSDPAITTEPEPEPVPEADVSGKTPQAETTSDSDAPSPDMGEEIEF
jgi:hypothetical protein